MYNIRMRNFLSLCPASIDSIFSFCHKNFADYICFGLREKDLIIRGFSSFDYVETCKDKLEAFFKDFCFLCADCGNEVEIFIEEV